MQINSLLQTLFRRKRCIFIHKKFGACKPEPIDALLDISHHKQIMPAFRLHGNRTHDLFLYLVAVLILINHDFCKMSAEFFCGMPWLLCFFVHENPQSKMLNIGKVNNSLLSFCRFHCLCIFKCQPYQLFEKRTQAFLLQKKCLQIHRKIFFLQRFHFFFHIRPDLHDRFLFLTSPENLRIGDNFPKTRPFKNVCTCRYPCRFSACCSCVRSASSVFAYACGPSGSLHNCSACVICVHMSHNKSLACSAMSSSISVCTSSCACST